MSGGPHESGLVHLVREPEAEPRGALILNHGRGSDERDLWPLLDELDPERSLVGITTGAPFTQIPPGGRHWYVIRSVGYPDPETFHRSYELLTGFIDSFLAERGLDWSRTVIGGFSMGSVMSHAVALGPGRPRPAGVIGLSGFIPTVEGWEPELDGREGMPVLLHHGRQDPIISIDFARRAQEVLEAGGVDLTYLESDAGHWLPPEILPRLGEHIARAIGASAT